MTTREGPAAFLPPTLAVSVVARQCPGGVPAPLPASWLGPRHQPLWGKRGPPSHRAAWSGGPSDWPSIITARHPCRKVTGPACPARPLCLAADQRENRLVLMRRESGAKALRTGAPAGWLCSPPALTFSAVLSCSQNPRASPISTCTCALLFS